MNIIGLIDFVFLFIFSRPVHDDIQLFEDFVPQFVLATASVKRI